MLTPENYSKGLLIDDKLMGGVSEHPDQAGRFIGYVMATETAEYLRYGEFDTLQEALAAVNSVDRPWHFENAGGCGDCKDGGCKEGGCKKGGSKEGAHKTGDSQSDLPKNGGKKETACKDCTCK